MLCLRMSRNGFCPVKSLSRFFMVITPVGSWPCTHIELGNLREASAKIALCCFVKVEHKEQWFSTVGLGGQDAYFGCCASSTPYASTPNLIATPNNSKNFLWEGGWSFEVVYGPLSWVHTNKSWDDRWGAWCLVPSLHDARCQHLMSTLGWIVLLVSDQLLDNATH